VSGVSKLAASTQRQGGCSRQPAAERRIECSRLRTNVRTLENWEQGRAKPNAPAALLINLVKRSDTVERLTTI